MTCAHCSRPANIKIVVRDEYERVRDVYVCDTHNDLPRTESRKEYMERKYG